jgi:hypothetical protein
MSWLTKQSPHQEDSMSSTSEQHHLVRLGGNWSGCIPGTLRPSYDTVNYKRCSIL